ncbi:hypothetical protein [Ruminococcus sp.]|uniref:hypothetical protein n=1 Tax=Ruminococcus sp. TaxID=41978 RepID=UPI0025CF6200|nr:hypothetical protein [Ruminococcus sp.]
MKKIISMVSAFALTAAMLLPQSLTASAAGTMDTLPYTLRFVPDRNFVSAEEVANGDVVITASVYVTGSTANTFGAATVKFDSDSSHVYFQNMVTGDNGSRLDEEKTYESSRGSFTTSLVPYCFGSLRNDRYSSGSPTFSTREFACDPIFGSTLYSTGDGSVKFNASYYEGIDKDGDGILERDEEKGKVSNTFVCTVTQNADGSGTYSFDYIDQKSFLTMQISATIPRYDATLPEGSLIPDSCNSVLWLAGTSQLSSGASFFGDTSDEFPLFQVDVVIEQGTPCGVYNIDFIDVVDPTTGIPCQLTSATQKNYPLEKLGTSIAVGVESASVTSTEQDEAALYASHDAHTIRATDFSDSILADLTYSEIDETTGAQRTEENVDITRLVDCYSATPKQLFASQAENGYYSSSNAPLYFNGSILTWKETGESVTQKIMIGKKGDINYDGNVDASDAYEALLYYAKKSVGSDAKLYSGTSTDPHMEDLTFFLADIDTCSKTGATDSCMINGDDAYHILMYYATASVGGSVSWDKYMK